MGYLKTKTLNKEPGETEFREHGTILTEDNNIITPQYIKGELGLAQIKLSITNPIDGYIHSHFPGTLSVFSVSDLATLAALYKNGKIKDTGTFVMGVVTASGTQYMLTIDDPAQFGSFANNFLNANNQFSDDAIKMQAYQYKQVNNISVETSAENNEINFVKFLEDNNSGLKVLKGDATFSNWSLLQKDANGNISPKNCD